MFRHVINYQKELAQRSKFGHVQMTVTYYTSTYILFKCISLSLFLLAWHRYNDHRYPEDSSK